MLVTWSNLVISVETAFLLNNRIIGSCFFGLNSKIVVIAFLPYELGFLIERRVHKGVVNHQELTMNAKLADTQNAILKAAAGRADGNIEPLPPTLSGGTRTKVITGLLIRKLIGYQVVVEKGIDGQRVYRIA